MAEEISVESVLNLNIGQAINDLKSVARVSPRVDVQFNTDQLSRSINTELTRLRQARLEVGLDSVAVRGQLKSVFGEIGKDLGESISESISNAKVDVRGGGILGRLISSITAPFRSVVTGLFEGIGNEVTRSLGAGIREGIERQLRPVIGSTELIGERIGEVLIDSISNSVRLGLTQLQGTDLYRNLLEPITKDLFNNLKAEFQAEIEQFRNDVFAESKSREFVERRNRETRLSQARQVVGVSLRQELEARPARERQLQTATRRLQTITSDEASAQIRRAQREAERRGQEAQQLLSQLNREPTDYVSKYRQYLQQRNDILTQLSTALESGDQQLANQLQARTRRLESILTTVETAARSRFQSFSRSAERTDLQRRVQIASQQQLRIATAITARIDEQQQLRETIARLERELVLPNALQDLERLGVDIRKATDAANISLERTELKRQAVQLGRRLQSQIQSITGNLEQSQTNLSQLQTELGDRADAATELANNIIKLNRIEQLLIDRIAVSEGLDVGVEVERIQRTINQVDEQIQILEQIKTGAATRGSQAATIAQAQEELEIIRDADSSIKEFQVLTKELNDELASLTSDVGYQSLLENIKTLEEVNQRLIIARDKLVLDTGDEGRSSQLVDVIRSINRLENELEQTRDNFNRVINSRTANYDRINDEAIALAQELRALGQSVGISSESLDRLLLDINKAQGTQYQALANADESQQSINQVIKSAQDAIRRNTGALQVLQGKPLVITPPDTIKTGELDALVAKQAATVKEVTDSYFQSIIPTSTDLNRVFKTVLARIESDLGTQLKLDPKLIVGVPREGRSFTGLAQGASVVAISDEVANLLTDNVNGINEQALEVLIHEIRHLFQQSAAGTGTNTVRLERLRQSFDLLQATQSELESQIGQNIEFSVKEAVDEARRLLSARGIRGERAEANLAAIEALSRATEEDAYVFARRNLEQIKNLIESELDQSTTAIAKIEPEQSGIVGAVSQKINGAITALENKVELLVVDIINNALRQVPGQAGTIDLSRQIASLQELDIDVLKQLAGKGAQQALISGVRGAQQAYGLAQGAESAVLGLDPLGVAKAVKEVLKPLLIAGAATAIVPGGAAIEGQLINATAGALAPLADVLGGQLSTTITGAITEVIGGLPVIGGQLATALNAAIESGIASGATGVAEILAGAFGAIGTGKAIELGTGTVAKQIAGAESTQKALQAAQSAEQGLIQFSDRATKVIAGSAKQFNRIVEAIKVTQLPASVEPFKLPAIADQRQLTGTLERDVNVKGLREIYKELFGNVGKSLNRQALVDQITQRFQDDATNVLKAIAKVSAEGLKAGAETIRTARAPLNEKQVLQSFKENQKTFDTAIAVFDSLASDQQGTVAEKLELLNQLIETELKQIIEAKRKFDLRGKTAQSLGGYEQRLRDLQARTEQRIERLNQELEDFDIPAFAVSPERQPLPVSQLPERIRLAQIPDPWEDDADRIRRINESRRRQRELRREADAAELSQFLASQRRGLPISQLPSPREVPVQDIRSQVNKLTQQYGNLLNAPLEEIYDGIKKAIANSADTASNRIRQAQRDARQATANIDQALRQADAETRALEQSVQRQESVSQRAINRTVDRLFRRGSIETLPQTIKVDEIIPEGNQFDRLFNAIALRFKRAFEANPLDVTDFIKADAAIEQIAAGLIVRRSNIQSVQQAQQNLINLIKSRARVEAEIEQRVKESTTATQERRLEIVGEVAALNQLIETDAARTKELEEQVRLGQKSIDQVRELEELEKRLVEALNANNQAQLNQVIKDIDAATRTIDGLGGNVGGNLFTEFIDSAKRGLNELPAPIRRATSASKGLIVAIAGFAAFQFFEVGSVVSGLQRIASEAINTTKTFESLQKSLEFTAGSAEKGAAGLDFVLRTAERLNVPIQSSIKGFQQLSAAAQGNTALQRTLADTTEGILQASRALNLTTDQQDRAINALSQIASKGVVSQEELRGQLAEAIPNATQIAARAYGTTVQGLNELVEAGIPAEEFLARFSRQLKRETFLGAARSADTLSASTQNLSNQYFLLQKNLGGEFAGAAKVGFSVLSNLTELAAKNTGLLSNAIKLTTIALLTGLGRVALAVFPGLQAAVTNLAARFTGLSFSIQGASAAIKGLGTGLAAFVTSTTGRIFLAITAVTELVNGISALNAVGRDSRDVLDALAASSEDAGARIQSALEKVDASRTGLQKLFDATNIFGDPNRTIARTRAALSEQEQLKESERVFQQARELLNRRTRGEAIDAQEIERAANRAAVAIDGLKSVSFTDAGRESFAFSLIQQNKDLLIELGKVQDAINGVTVGFAELAKARNNALKKAEETESAGLLEIEKALDEGVKSQAQAEKKKAELTIERLRQERRAQEEFIGSQRSRASLGTLTTKEREELTKSEQSLTDIVKKEIEARNRLRQSELQVIDEVANKSLAVANEAEQLRTIELLKLQESGAISHEDVEQKKLKITIDRIRAEIAAEDAKIQAIKAAGLNDAEREAALADAQSSRNAKIIELLNAQIQAQTNLGDISEAADNEREKAIDRRLKQESTALDAQKRQLDNKKRQNDLESETIDLLNQQLDRTQRINDSTKSLIEARGELSGAITAGRTAINDTRIEQLERARDIQRQLREDAQKTNAQERLSLQERQALQNELASLSVNAGQSDLSLLQEIQRLQNANHQLELRRIDEEYNRRLRLLDIDRQSLDISYKKLENDVKRSQIEARNRQLEIRSQQVDARRTIAEGEADLAKAQTAEEAAAAQEKIRLGQDQLRLADEQTSLAQEQLGFAKGELEVLKQTKANELEILDIKRRQLEVDRAAQVNAANAQAFNEGRATDAQITQAGGGSQVRARPAATIPDVANRRPITVRLDTNSPLPQSPDPLGRLRLNAPAPQGFTGGRVIAQLPPLLEKSSKAIEGIEGQLTQIVAQLAKLPIGNVNQSISIQATDTADIERKSRNAAMDGVLSAFNRVGVV